MQHSHVDVRAVFVLSVVLSSASRICRGAPTPSSTSPHRGRIRHRCNMKHPCSATCLASTDRLPTTFAWDRRTANGLLQADIIYGSRRLLFVAHGRRGMRDLEVVQRSIAPISVALPSQSYSVSRKPIKVVSMLSGCMIAGINVFHVPWNSIRCLISCQGFDQFLIRVQCTL